MAGFKFTPRWQDIAELLKEDPDRFYALMEDRERGLEAYLDYGESTYTPEITATTTAPSIGDDGHEFGVFSLQGRMCDFSGQILFDGAGIGAGSGIYLVPLPIPPLLYTVESVAVARMVGACMWNDITANRGYMGQCLVYGPTSTTAFRVQLDEVTGFNWTSSSPAAPADGDHLRFWGRYMIDEQ